MSARGFHLEHEMREMDECGGVQGRLALAFGRFFFISWTPRQTGPNQSEEASGGHGGNDICHGTRLHEPKRVRRRARESDVGGSGLNGPVITCSDVRHGLPARGQSRTLSMEFAAVFLRKFVLYSTQHM